MFSKRTILSLVVQLLVILSFSFYFLYNSPIYTYEENFENTENIFGSYKNYSYTQTLKNGFFITENNTMDLCLLNKSPVIDFPTNYTLTAKHYQKKGFGGNFGVVLISDSLNYVSFLIDKRGWTTIEVYENGNIIKSKSDFLKVFNSDHHSYNQIIKIKNNKYTYYIDDKFVKEDRLPSFGFRQIGFEVCDYSTVALDKIKIKDDDKNEIILEENFNAPNKQETQRVIKDWNIRTQLTYAIMKNNKFLINHHQKSTCLNQTAFLPKLRKNSHWSLSANIKWINFEHSPSQSFGFSFIRDNGFEESKVEFTLSKTGYVYFKTFYDDKYKKPITDRQVKTDFELIEGKIYHLKIEQVSSEKLVFYVDGEKIAEKFLYYQPIRKIGLVICGEQVVEIDNVKYEEYRL